MKRLTVILSLALAGCETGSPDTPIQPVTIGVSEFCAVMKEVAPPSGKPTWSVQDTPQTIRGNRRLGAAVDNRCLKSKPTS